MPKTKAKPKAGKTWPDRVRALLERYDWTHAELARRIGVSRVAVTQYGMGYLIPRPIRLLLAQIEKNPDATVDAMSTVD